MKSVSNSPARTSLGFLLVGILGVLVGAIVVAWASGKIFTQSSSFPAFQAASAAIGKAGNESDFERRVIAAAKSAGAGVVLIKSTLHGQQINPFYEFFGPQSGPEVQPFVAHASGSGFVVKRTGNTAIVVTDAHVIYGADKIEVALADGRKVSAQKLGSDIRTDIAVLKISGSNLPAPLTLGDSNALEPGQFVIAIGEPESFQNSVSFGIVSALHRHGITATGGGGVGPPPISYSDLLQTTTPINPGNSGGPLVTLDGHVVGITAVVDPRAQAIGFAIPINIARPIVAELETNHVINHPYIGIYMEPLSPQIASYLNYHGTGVVVDNVIPGSPADRAGLQQGDVIVQLNHVKMNSPDEISGTIAKGRAGESVSLLIWRQGNLQPVSVTLSNQPETLPQG
jgi:serine protease Do